MGLCLGTAIPQGSFPNTDFDEETSGYAKTGFLFTFDGAWFPDDYLGIGATVTFASNNIDRTKYKEDLIADIHERYPDFPEDLDFYYDVDVWKYLNLHIGPNVTVPFGRFNFDIRAHGGLTLAWAPAEELSFKNDEIDFNTKRQKKPVPTLGFTVGAGLRYAFQNNFVLRVIGDYSGSKPTFETTEIVIDNNGIPEEKTTKVDFPINNIHVGIGIAYNFVL